MKIQFNLFCFISTLTTVCSSYHWTIFGDASNVCNNNVCGDRPHSSCLELEPSESCEDFEWIPINNLIKYILLGHNGLRNRVANAYKNTVANMNYIHWDYSLQRMAKGWIAQCKKSTDSCDYIYNETYTVGQNIYFMPRIPASKRYAIPIIRRWFLEGNKLNDSLFGSFDKDIESNYTQLMWAKSEFVGCAAAKMFGGYLMACNYHPKGNVVNEPVFVKGEPCSKCSTDRSYCSKIFTGLCGIDDPRANANAFIDNFILIIVMTLLTIFNLFAYLN